MALGAREDDSERRFCFSEEVVAKRKYYSTWKFRRGWIELRGLPFPLWNENQLCYIMMN